MPNIAVGVVPSLVYYRPPSLRHMEIYSLDFRIYDRLVGPSHVEIHAHDFTAPVRTSLSLSPMVLEQLNHGTFLARQLQEMMRQDPHRAPPKSYSLSALLFVRKWRIMRVSVRCIHAITSLKSVLLPSRLLAGARGISTTISACGAYIHTKNITFI